jgi:Rps23 Pro-64 3,4-dihydroxylase Tpa1-like proline 4-hydroxylase
MEVIIIRWWCWSSWLKILLLLLVLVILQPIIIVNSILQEDNNTNPRFEFLSPQHIKTKGYNNNNEIIIPGCTKPSGSISKRILIQDFLSDHDVELLLSFAKRGMKDFDNSEYGPTIFDPDLLMVLGPGAQIKRVDENQFTDEELQAYSRMMIKTKQFVMEQHELTTLYHTAPTFIARLRPPLTQQQQQQHEHDEYFHLHVDKNNTEHYSYSALLYLSDYGIDFNGGIFEFWDGETNNDTIWYIQPKKKSLLTFASGLENPHRVSPVIKGTRFALSTWWTCSKEYHFTKSRLSGLMMENKDKNSGGDINSFGKNNDEL